MGEQLPLLDTPAPVACGRTLEDLARDVRGGRPLPLWAAVAGPAWFARAWGECASRAAIGALAGAAFGWRWRDPDCEPCCVPCWWLSPPPDECRACADILRKNIGVVTLAMVREGLARRCGRG